VYSTSTCSSSHYCFWGQRRRGRRRRQQEQEQETTGTAYASASFSSSSSGSGGGRGTHYYDSQSGLHMEHHDDTKISVYWNALQTNQKKVESSSSLLQIRATASELGMAGVLLFPDQQAAQQQQQAAYESLPPVGFTTTTAFLCGPPTPQSSMFPDLSSTTNNHILLEYRNASKVALQEALSSYHHHHHAVSTSASSSSTTTSIGMFQTSLYQTDDPILVAADVAGILDDVDIDFLWLVPPKETSNNGGGDDDMVALCQELVYLDLTGPTMKSRLIVDAMTPDQVEECLLMGINKFVINDANDMTSQLDWLKGVVEEQGKELCLLLPSSTATLQ